MAALADLAQAALHRLGRAAPTAEVARVCLDAIGKIGSGPPYTIAIAGEPAARAALLDHLAGEPLFDGRRDPPRVVMTMQRGAVTKLRARKRDGSVEERAITATASGALVVEDKLIVDEAPAPVVVENTLAVRRPPWWAVWRWLLLWIRSWRREPARLVEAPRPTAKPSARPIADPRTQFVDTFRDLFADEAVERIFLDVAGGPLPDKLVIIELPSGADPKVLATTGVDVCVVAYGDAGLATTPQLEAVLRFVPHVFAVGPKERFAASDDRVKRLGDAAAVAPALIDIAEIERGIAIGVRAIAVVADARTTLAGVLDRAEAEFRARIDGLHGRRIPDVDQLIAAELARLRPAIVEHAHRSLRRAVKRLDADIGKLAESWSAQLTDASSTDALRTVAAKLDESSTAALQAIRTEARRVLLDDLTEYTLAQYLEFISKLRDGTSRTDPLPSVLAIEVSVGDVTVGTNLGAVAPRLTSMFRSLDALKTATVAQLDQRVDTLRQHATALFLDSEPRVEPAMTAAIAIALHGDAERHLAWLEAELAREQTAVETERAALAGIATAHDAAAADERELVDAVEVLERELP